VEDLLNRNRWWGLAAAVVAILWAATMAAVPGAFGDEVGSRSRPDPTWIGPWGAPTVYLALYTATPIPTPKPTPKPKPARTPDTLYMAKRYAKAVLGPTQYACIDAIFTRESNWNYRARNPKSGAYGIPQALPGSKMAAFGSNWRYSPMIQTKWGIWYVNTRYGSACQAYAFMLEHGWY
jgi:hypothetical protein